MLDTRVCLCALLILLSATQPATAAPSRRGVPHDSTARERPPQVAAEGKDSKAREALLRMIGRAYRLAVEGRYEEALTVGYQALGASRAARDEVAEPAILNIIGFVHLKLGDNNLGPKLYSDYLVKQIEVMNEKGVKDYYVGATEIAIDMLKADEGLIFLYAQANPFIRQIFQQPDDSGAGDPEELSPVKQKLQAEYESRTKPLYLKLSEAEKNRDIPKYRAALLQLTDILVETMTRAIDQDENFPPENIAPAKESARAMRDYLRGFLGKDKAKARGALLKFFDLIETEIREDEEEDEEEDGGSLDDVFGLGMENELADYRRSGTSELALVFKEIFTTVSPKSYFNAYLLHFMKADRSIEPILARYGYISFSELEAHGAAILEASGQSSKRPLYDGEKPDLVDLLPEDFSPDASVVAILSASTPEGKWLYDDDVNRLKAAAAQVAVLSGGSGGPGDAASGYSDQSLFLRRAVSSYDEGKFAEARAALERALGSYRRGGDSEGIWQAQFMLGLLYRKQGDTARAINSLRDAADTIEAMRSGFRSERIRTLLVEDKIFVYEFLIDLLVGARRHDEAFAYLEKTKARVMLDRLLDPRAQVLPRLKAPASARAQSALARVNELMETRLEEGVRADTEAFEAVNRRLAEEGKSYLLSLEELRYTSPEFASIALGETLPVEEVRKLIGDDTVLIEYFTGADKTYIFAVRNKAPVEVFVVNLGLKDLEQKVERFRAAIEQGKEPFEAQAREFYKALIEPVEAQLGGRRLCIVPHGALHFLPFQALMKGDRYLVQDYQIFYSSSASALKYTFGNRREGKRKVGIVALTEKSIPSVAEEAQKIARTFTEAQVLLDRGATKKAVMSALGDADVLHFITHSILDEQEPLLSSLTLAGGERLTVTDLYGLETKASLVVLSSCETHLSRYTAGDELSNLTRAFSSAGVPSVVTSLWRVGDDSRARLMTSFYEKLIADGLGKGEALRQAQLALLNSAGKFSHPREWAPFILVGDYR